MAPTRFWIEGTEQASLDGGVDAQIAIVTLTGTRLRILSSSPEFPLVATEHEEND